MSQNGPPAGPSEVQPAADPPHAGRSAPPVDPWAIPTQPRYAAEPDTVPGTWGRPTRRGPRTGPAVLLCALLLVAGAAVAVRLLAGTGVRSRLAHAATAVSPPAGSGAATEPDDSAARFVTAGQCVRLDGSEDVPRMSATGCGPGTYRVLRRVNGRTNGQTDAERKCSAVPGYTTWYYYDSQLDDLDFVLCLRSE